MEKNMSKDKIEKFLERINWTCPRCKCENALTECFPIPSKYDPLPNGAIAWRHFRCLCCFFAFGLRITDKGIEAGWNDNRINLIEEFKKIKSLYG